MPRDVVGLSGRVYVRNFNFHFRLIGPKLIRLEDFQGVFVELRFLCNTFIRKKQGAGSSIHAKVQVLGVQKPGKIIYPSSRLAATSVNAKQW